MGSYSRAYPQDATWDGILPPLCKCGDALLPFSSCVIIQYAEKVHTPVFSPCHRKRSKIGTEVKLGATVVSMFWGEQQAIESTTSIKILVLNYVVYT